MVLGSDQDKLELEEGDVIRLDATTEAVAHLRPREITLYSPGLLYGGNKPILEAGEAPTLLQFLAWQYRPMLNDELKALESNQNSSSAHLWSPDEVSQALSKRTDVGPFAVLPYPDWARVEIRRLREDGTEEVIPVNLRAAIDACTEETLLEEARAVDRPLQWGDQVALPVMEPKGDAPWNGLD